MALNKVPNPLPSGPKRMNPSRYAQGLRRSGSLPGPATLSSLHSQGQVGAFWVNAALRQAGALKKLPCSSYPGPVAYSSACQAYSSLFYMNLSHKKDVQIINTTHTYIMKRNVHWKILFSIQTCGSIQRTTYMDSCCLLCHRRMTIWYRKVMNHSAQF